MPPRRAHRMPRPVAPGLLEHARESRQSPTEAEKRVWAGLRAHRLGPHFRRQHPIDDRFIVDFFCADAHLCVEIDGESHAQPEQVEYDAARIIRLKELGYRVLRFTNQDVRKNLLTTV